MEAPDVAVWLAEEFDDQRESSTTVTTTTAFANPGLAYQELVRLIVFASLPMQPLMLNLCACRSG